MVVNNLKMEKAIALLSGGIDSPVAIAKMQDKLNIIAVHFHQVPLSDEKEVDKVKELAKLLNLKKLYLIPFAEVFKEIVNKCRHKDFFVLSKILMFKAAEVIAKDENAKFLITGENLAQVSSQTLPNLEAISSQIKLTIFRPLLTFDKQEIINYAKELGTYETSKGPEICCLLGPKHPSTNSSIEIVEKELKSIDVNMLIKESLNKAELIEY